MGNELTKRHCPIDGDKVKSCIHCKNCSIMSGFGGAGAFSDGKYNITNDFGGTLYEYIGKKICVRINGICRQDQPCFLVEKGTKLYSTAGSSLKTRCMQNGLHLLDASVRHLGTDINYIVLEHLYDHLKEKIDFHFNCFIDKVENWIADIESIMKIPIMMVKNALFPQGAVEVNGWKMSVGDPILIRIRIAWISESEWNFRQEFLHI